MHSSSIICFETFGPGEGDVNQIWCFNGSDALFLWDILLGQLHIVLEPEM